MKYLGSSASLSLVGGSSVFWEMNDMRSMEG